MERSLILDRSHRNYQEIRCMKPVPLCVSSFPEQVSVYVEYNPRFDGSNPKALRGLEFWCCAVCYWPCEA